MKKLLIYLKDYKKESILGPLFKLIEALFDLAVPMVVALLIDRGISRSESNYVVRMCLILAGLALAGLGFSITAQYFAAKASAGFGKVVRHALFDTIQKLSYTEMDTLGTATMITRMTSDMNQLQYGLNQALRLLLRSPFVVFGAMIMAFTIDVRSALVFAVTIPILSVIVFGIILWCIPKYKQVQGRLDRILARTRENLTGVRVIRAFCLEKEETRQFQAENAGLTDLQRHVGRVSALLNPVTYVLINLATAALIWVGALRVNMGALSQGQVVALYNYMAQVLVELIKLANLILTITKSIACGDRIESVLEMKSSMADGREMAGESSGEPVVEFRHADLCYHSAGANSLTDISFSVKRGQTIGIIGGTGAGKTSLVNLIPRFYDVTKGEILVDGRNVKEYEFDALREKIGIVPQSAVLFKGTIRENIQWGKKDASDSEIWAALETAQAKEVAEKKAGGLDFEVEQGGKNLSGGQKQRFTIARALVRKPEILILDDSASALDFATDAALRKSIRAMEGSPTVFIVSQRDSSVRYADQIIVLDDGKIAGIGKHDELLASCEVYREIYESQFKKEEA